MVILQSAMQLLLTCCLMMWVDVHAQVGSPPPLPANGTRLYQGLMKRPLPNFAMIAARGVQKEDIGDPDSNGYNDGINDGLWCQSANSGQNIGAWYRPDGQVVSMVDGPLMSVFTSGQVGLERIESIKPSPYQGMYTCTILDEYETNQTLAIWMGSNSAYFPLANYPIPNPYIEPISMKFYPPTHSRDHDPPEFTLSFEVTNAPPTYVTCVVGTTPVYIEPSSLSRQVLQGQYVVNEDGVVMETVRTEVNVMLKTRQAGDYQCSISVFRANQPSIPLTEPATPKLMVTVTGTPLNVAVTKETATSARVSWSTPASNSPPVAGYEVFYQTETNVTTSGGETSASQLSLVLTELDSTTSYSVFVVAFGGDLPSARSSIVIIPLSVPPALKNGQGTAVSREIGQSVSFNCTADGLPIPTVSWRRNGQLLLSSPKYSTQNTDPAPGFRSGDLPGVLEVTSVLTVTNLKATGQGTYSCRADNGEGDGAVMDEPYQLSVVEIMKPNPCLTTPCQNGGTCFQTDDTDAGYICSCMDAFSGSHCEQHVVIEIAPKLTQPPLDTSASLYSEVSLTCGATGSPQPVIKWFKNGAILFRDTAADSPILIISEMSVADRGFYYCVASNSAGSVVSGTVVLNVDGLVQYEEILQLSENFYNSKRKRQENEQLQELVAMINELIVGTPISDAVIFSVTLEESVDAYPMTVTIVVTVLTERGGSEQLLMALQEELTQLGDILPDVTIDSGAVGRFDGCRSNVTYIESDSKNPDLLITLHWPETNLGEVAFLSCPCGGNLTTSSLQASRYCTGSFEDGAFWDSPNDSPCDFSDLAREVCLLSNATADEKVEVLENITANIEEFDSVEISVSAEILITTSEDVAGNEELTNDFLTVVGNLLEVDGSVLQESQETSKTSSKLLESLEAVTASIPIPENSTEPVVITQPTFAVSVQEVEPELFSGFTFSASVGSGPGAELNSDSLTFGENSNNAKAPRTSMSLPANLFQSIHVTNTTRITQSVFINDALFLRRNITVGQLEVGAIILSAEVVGSEVAGLDPPITLTFLKNQNMNGRDPTCRFWNAQLDDGYGDWSTEGCSRVDYIESDAQVTCHCTHLSSFTILLDVSPEIVESNTSDPLQIALEAISYIGAIISILCLLVTIISYLAVLRLRSSPHGQLLINLCLALLGLYVMFICAIHSAPVPALCAIVAALLQYFFLVTFMVMAAEAIDLYMKLVVVLGKGLQHYVLKASLISWLTPFFIVIFCFAPDYSNYISDHFCRAFGFPFYIGTIVPFVIIYVFNWIMYVIILGSLICKSRPGVDTKTIDRRKLKQQFVIAITLSLLFGLGWGIGLPATQALYIAPIRDTFSVLFIILTAFQGLFVFIMHTLRSQEVQKLWKRWLLCKKQGTDRNARASAAYTSNSRDLRQRETSETTRTMSISSVLKTTIKRGGRNPEAEAKVRMTTSFTSIQEDPSIESSTNENHPELNSVLPTANQNSVIQDYPSNLVDAIAQREHEVAVGDLKHLINDPDCPDQTLPTPDYIFENFDGVSLGEKSTGDCVFFNLPAGALELDTDSILSFQSGLEKSTVLPNPALADET